MSREQRRTQQILDNLYEILPCATMEEITDKLNARGLNVSRGAVEQVMARLRKEAPAWGWTIPHVKRGPAMNGEEHRYFAVLCTKDGWFMDSHDKGNLRKGVVSTVQLVATQTNNSAKALEAAALHSASRSYAHALRDWAEDLKYISRKGRTLTALIQADGTNG